MNNHINKILRFIFLFTLFVFLSVSCAQNNGDSLETYPQVEIAGSEVREFQSDITGNKYFIQVALPRSYNDSQKTYPVLYIMDSDGAFGTCTEITRLLAVGKEVTEILIVGIAYGVTFNEYLYNRQRDYTPTVLEKYAGSGGGKKFLKFIDEELIPFVETKYRVKKSDRAICGFSYGGLFALYTLFHKPKLFNRYLVGSPSFFWDSGILFEYEKKYFENSSDLPVKLFMSVGSQENQKSFINPFNNFTQIMNSRRYQGLEMISIILEDETHYSSYGNAFTKGIRWLFKTD